MVYQCIFYIYRDFHCKTATVSMLTAAVKRDGVKPGMQTAVEGAREAEKLKRERETICFQDWLINSGLLGEVSENARPKEREGERERCR